MSSNQTPFFSIIMPTKNRASLLSFAIQGVLNQSFKDFELIIADNDDSNETQNVVNSYSDPRIKYHRTGNIGMIQNWNAGFELASGEYFMVAGDKIVFYPNALLDLYNVITDLKVPMVCYLGDSYDDSSDRWHFVNKRRTDGRILKKSTHEVLNKIKNSLYVENPESHNWLPAPNKSATSRELMRKVKDLAGGYSFGGSADYNNGFLKLFLCDQVHLLNKSLYLTSTVKSSAGAQCSYDKEFTKKLRLSYNEREDFSYEFVPLKFHCSSNFMINEIMRCQKIATGSIEFDIDPVEYFVAVYADINNRYAFEKGVVYAEEQAIWDKEFSKLPESMQSRITLKIIELSHIKDQNKLKSIKKMIKQVPFLYKTLKNMTAPDDATIVSGSFKTPIEYIKTHL